MTLAGGNCAIERATWTTCERNDVRRLIFQPFQFQPRWFVRRRVEKRTRIKAHEAAITLRTRCEQYDAAAFGRRISVTRTVVGVTEVHGQGTANERLEAVTPKLFGKFQGAEHVGGVCQRKCRLMVGLGKFREARKRERTFQQRKRRVHV